MAFPAIGRCTSVMVCGVKQHTGKTSVSMTLLAGLREKFGNDKVGFMKPVGQRHKIIDNQKVDEDAMATREHFNLSHCSFRDMSPVVIDRTYTRRYLEGLVSHEEELANIRRAFKNLCQGNDFVICEGTGHVGVGSVVGLSNARVARELGLEIVLVANGGLGSTFDELELNRTLCLAHGVRVRGIILNKIVPEKLDMVRQFAEKAFESRWGIPLLGCVPNGEFLDSPSMLDLRRLFNVELLSGQQHQLRHFQRFELVTTSLRRFMEKLSSSDKHNATCFVTHASRNDIVMGLISHAHACGSSFKGGMILTGTPPGNVPASCIMDYVKASEFPVLNVNCSTSECMTQIKSFTAKMHANDKIRINRVIAHYSPHIDLDLLIQGTKRRVSEAAVPRVSATPLPPPIPTVPGELSGAAVAAASP